MIKILGKSSKVEELNCLQFNRQINILDEIIKKQMEFCFNLGLNFWEHKRRVRIITEITSIMTVLNVHGVMMMAVIMASQTWLCGSKIRVSMFYKPHHFALKQRSTMKILMICDQYSSFDSKIMRKYSWNQSILKHFL